MPSRFEKYRLKDGVTRLGASFFNPVFQDIDLRISGLESLQVAWEVAVAKVTQFGLVRINEVIAPTSTELDNIRADALAALADLQTALDTFEAAGLADILAWKNDVTAQISGLSTAVETAESNATADIAAWKASHLAEISALISHVGNTSNPHTVTKAQVGLGNVNNTADVDKPISTAVANALADKASTTHNHAGVYQPADPDLDAWAGKTVPSGAVVGTTDTQGLSNKNLIDPTITGAILEDIYTITDGAGFEIDPGNGTIQLITLGASRTPKATNFQAGESVMLMVDDGAAFTLTWTDTSFGSGGIVWKTGGGVPPILNTTGYTFIELCKVGSQVYGWRAGDA